MDRFNYKMDNIIKNSIENTKFEPLLAINKEYLVKYIETKYFLYYSKDIRKLLKFLDRNNIEVNKDKIEIVYDYLEDVFHSFEKKKDEYYINKELYGIYDREENVFYYNSKIYDKLAELKFSKLFINLIIKKFIEEKIKYIVLKGVKIL